MRQPRQRITAQGLDLKDQVISINRVTKVVKGGKNMSFAALVVNHLRVDMIQTTINCQARTLRRAAHLTANALVNRAANCCSISLCHN